MQSPHPPHPPRPPHPGTAPGESDRTLVARLRDADGGHHAVAGLLARHWRATHDYAVICLAASGSSAAMVATAAFHQVLRRLTGGAAGGALRPQLLVAARDTVREWAADDGICAVLPELRRPTGGRGLRAVRSMTPEKRQLAERAFQALPGASQCLLWHTEVEAEPITTPAGLLAMGADTAAAALEQAREQFRAGCVRAHRELAPTKECRFYNRLLDIPIRRGGALLPDVRRHLTECRYCRHAAEQLSHFDGGLEVLLAETVLGWGARRYLDSRPARAAAEAPQASGPTHPGGGGRHRTALVGPDEPLRRHRKALAVGVALTSLALLATVLVVKGWTDDNAVPGPHVTWGAASSSSVRASEAGEPSSAASAASAVHPTEVAHGRLRSPAAGLWLDVHGGRVTAGAGAELAVCSAAGSQQWSYRDDGLLRSAVDPTLCLDSAPGRRTVLLSGRVVHAGEVAYDLTARGELLLRRRRDLLVAPATGESRAHVVVEARDGSERQRWLLDSGAGDMREAAPWARQTGGATGDQPAERSTPRRGAPPPPKAGTRRQEWATPEQEYEKRFVQIAAATAPGPRSPRPTSRRPLPSPKRRPSPPGSTW
ncbi:ricin-type beta-trefoil lectin domain protein [Streptomyces sp. NPDC005202]|uniref:ricin-type beta-trefoil lectin domain protein n=1 Tax=Streptomyces sp. NPDC005202 TaxID=3157021 RepID=UPI0033BF2A02